MYVYILKCNNGRYYIGSTPDIARRITEHNAGKSKFTKSLLPIQLVFSQKYPTLAMARKVERWLKRQKSKTLIERTIARGKIDKVFE